jgi:hydrogenase maturation protein HypF
MGHHRGTHQQSGSPSISNDPPRSSSSPQRTAVDLLLQGDVQGHGVRPAIVRLARQFGICGTVTNTSDGVAVHAESESEIVLREFQEQLTAALPMKMPLKSISARTGQTCDHRTFEIRLSDTADSVGVTMPVDVALCPACRMELLEPANRRANDAFISCAECGPRYSIIESLPFERSTTAMSGYELCQSCRQQYGDPDDRRFHAQTTSCPSCGPRLYSEVDIDVQRADCLPLLKRCAQLIRQGSVVGVKGIGGYQLICDAGNEDAVRRIRVIKQRPVKPLALMLSDTSRIVPPVGPSARATLSSPANPIVILDHHTVRGIASGVSSQFGSVGVMLPSTGLHELLLRLSECSLVVTSGNRDSEPIVFDPRDAGCTLAPNVDLLLHHDRPIHHPVDDSVVRIMHDRPVTLRCGRGLAPLPLALASPHSILAVGGQQKVALAVSNGRQCVLGPHLGDMSTVAARERFERHAAELQRLYGMRPELIVHDAHPDYFTTRWAEAQAVPTLAVQHHHAHVVAGMVEHRLLDKQVLGIACDGTGLGPDDTVWGGEFLLVTQHEYRRVGHIAAFPLAGGEAAIHAPWMTAVALLCTAGSPFRPELVARLQHGTAFESRCQAVHSIAASSGVQMTTSLGRLFDGVSALVLPHVAASFEGEAAMLLEAACDRAEAGSYRFPVLLRNGQQIMDWQPAVQQIVLDLLADVPSGQIAMRFHRGIASAIAVIAASFQESPVVVSGGCFQNRILTELVAEQLDGRAAGVYFPSVIPPNDGGLAAGQLAIGAARLDH